MGLLMKGIGRVYLDTNIFIGAFETEGELANLTASLLSRAADRFPQGFVTSEITLAELLVLPFRRNDAALVKHYSGLLSSAVHIDVPPVSRDILLKSARLRSDMPALKLPDAVHLATAALSGCTHVLTADKGMRLSTQVDYPLILRPDEQTLTHLLESLAR
jgi:predicted nucleic acid-binding protein